ncbi:MAG TPA: glycosyltransferase [Flavisolibacter sp.]|nr:glycosyltransferase [Flavisolibacter sp.]
MHDLPLVSIITPFLNTEKFFEECIESVLSQTYHNWELFLIDDGSFDGSTEIARSYAAKFPDQIFYLEHPQHQNRGASASRNLGIQTSTGKYIAFLDSDDIYLPRKLEDQVVLLNAQPRAGMLYSFTEYWHSWSGLPQDAERDWVWDNLGVMPNTLVEPPNLLTMFLQYGGTVPCMGSVLARREAIGAVGGWEEVFKYIYTDQVFHAKICLRWPVFVASGCWDKYRQHPDSSCHIVERTNKGDEAKRNFLTWLEGYLVQKGVQKDTALWKALKKALWPFKHPYLNKIAQMKWWR